MAAPHTADTNISATQAHTFLWEAGERMVHEIRLLDATWVICIRAARRRFICMYNWLAAVLPRSSTPQPTTAHLRTRSRYGGIARNRPPV